MGADFLFEGLPAFRPTPSRLDQLKSVVSGLPDGDFEDDPADLSERTGPASRGCRDRQNRL